jgi:dihydrofolate reductase
MAQVNFEISQSLDGYVAGPDPGLDEPLGKDGERLHDWVVGLESWRESHGKEGGERGEDSELLEAARARNGATIMGRKMYSSGSGPWEDDPKANGWWGDEPPFGHPVFVLTHHEREPLELKGTTFHYVTDGPEAALERARDAAGDKDVLVAGGAEAFQQFFAAGLLDELLIHTAPVVLGGGARLFDDLGAKPPGVELVEVIPSPAVTHSRYRVVR